MEDQNYRCKARVQVPYDSVSHMARWRRNLTSCATQDVSDPENSKTSEQKHTASIEHFSQSDPSLTSSAFRVTSRNITRKARVFQRVTRHPRKKGGILGGHGRLCYASSKAWWLLLLLLLLMFDDNTAVYT
nr:hypothetical protein CFP56_52440 [Quercus suber]